MRAIVTLALATALAACGSANDGEVKDTDGDGTLSGEEIESQLGGAMSRGEFMQAGQWESTISVEELSMPGLTDEMRENMKRQMGSQTYRTCLTQEEVEQPDSRFFTGEDADCTYERFSLKDGKIDSEMVCNVEGVRQRMVMSGDYGAESYDLSMRATSLSEQGIDMSMRVSAKRVGDCAGDPA